MSEPALVTLSPQQPLTRFSLRVGADDLDRAGRAFGVRLPALLHSASEGDRAALGLGPDEWLLLAPAGRNRTIAADFAERLRDMPHALVDVSDRTVALQLKGPGASALLSCGCPLDLDRFEVGQCSRTLFAKAEIMLWRIAATGYHVEVGRSFAGYLWGYLEEAGRDLGVVPGRPSPTPEGRP